MIVLLPVCSCLDEPQMEFAYLQSYVSHKTTKKIY